MNYKYFTFLLFLCNVLIVKAQEVEDLARTLTISCTTDEEKVRAIFVWLRDSIEYDNIKLNIFQNRQQTMSERQRVNTIINDKKGVCTDYALVFNKLCQLNNIESRIVKGYSYLSTSIGHAWNIAKINDEYFIFDATFAAGAKMVEEEHEKYYKIKPQNALKEYFPLLSIYQIIENPIDYVRFKKNDFDANALKINRYFRDSLQYFEQLSLKNQLIKEYFDIQRLGDSTMQHNQRAYYLANEIARLSYRDAVENINIIISLYNNRNFHLRTDSDLMQLAKVLNDDIERAIFHYEKMKAHGDFYQPKLMKTYLELQKNAQSKLRFIKAFTALPLSKRKAFYEKIEDFD